MPQRYEDEIEEILKQVGEVGPGPVKRRRSFLSLLGAYISKLLGGGTWSITPGRVMLVAGVVLLLGLLMPSLAPAGIWAPLAWGGLILFIVGYAMFFIRPRKVEKRWRGQPIDDGDEGLWERLKRRNR